MRRTEKLPKRKRGWPPIQELATDPSDSGIIEQNVLVSRLEKTAVNDRQYLNILDRIVSGILKGTTFITCAHKQFYIRNIDQDGTACTEEGKNVIQRLINKLEADFHKINSQDFADKMASRITWLYTSTPLNVIDYLRNNFTYQLAPGRFNRFVEAAGRAFNQPNDFKLLFRTIALNTGERRRLVADQQNNALPFPINSQRAICSSLMYRRESGQYLNHEDAVFFAKHALKRLRHAEQNNFNRLYFQLIRLLLYLLRCRRSNPSCFDPNNKKEIRPFLDAIDSMEKARKHLSCDLNPPPLVEDLKKVLPLRREIK